MARLVILMYHMVCDPQTKGKARYACPPGRFAQHMNLLACSPYNVVSMDQVNAFIADKTTLPEYSVTITFDDGFRDNYEQAFPILQKHNFPATIFLSTGMIDGSNKWMADKDYPSRPMLNWDQISEMQKDGVIFGGHTVNHVPLTQLADAEAYREIIGCRATLEERLGKPSRYFAYPYGLFERKHVEAVKKAGYELACSTRSGFNNSSTHPFELRRLETYGTDSARHLKRKIKFGTNDGRLLTEISYYAQRLKTRWFCQ